jgi:hypothetical protein
LVLAKKFGVFSSPPSSPLALAPKYPDRLESSSLQNSSSRLELLTPLDAAPPTSRNTSALSPPTERTPRLVLRPLVPSSSPTLPASSAASSRSSLAAPPRSSLSYAASAAAVVASAADAYAAAVIAFVVHLDRAFAPPGGDMRDDDDDDARDDVVRNGFEP